MANSQAPRRFWAPPRAKEQSLDAFLKENRPSSVQRSYDGWIWVVGPRRSLIQEAAPISEEVLLKARSMVKTLEDEIRSIDDDPNIPVRGRKGVLSKKQRREKAQADADLKYKLAELAVSSGFSVGKWLFFRRGTSVDLLFATLAKSISDGPLSRLKAAVTTVKAAVLPQQESEEQVVCLYFDDFFDQDTAREILTCVIKEHGVLPAAAKSDLYTELGITSKHPTGLRSTEYQPRELLMQSQIDDWQAAYNKTRDGGVKVRSKYDQVNEAGFEDDGSEDADNDNARKPVALSSPSKETSARLEARPLSSNAASPAKSPILATSTDADEDSVTESEDENEPRGKVTVWPKEVAATDGSAKRSADNNGRSAPTAAPPIKKARGANSRKAVF
ncbi:hypothetical protein CBOM_03959 [Ceraceosorus bombacis]|uniref:Uncharacterized protein n=1 Tax=Ceraceosorus bombacis TaxID=401625 RepID=A0A0P1BLE4_9BASI|nr:hypothetical protein CBOM_03959 [Ceraceosorus bombacis]